MTTDDDTILETLQPHTSNCDLVSERESGTVSQSVFFRFIAVVDIYAFILMAMLLFRVFHTHVFSRTGGARKRLCARTQPANREKQEESRRES